MCWERGSLQGLPLAQAAQAGEADVANCQEDLPACHPQDCCSTSPRNFKIHLHVCMCAFASPPAPDKFPPSFRLSNFYFLCDRSYNLKMLMCGLLWSLMRTSLYCVLTSIRQDYRDRGTHWHLVSVTVTALAAGMPDCHSRLYRWAFSPPSVD